MLFCVSPFFQSADFGHLSSIWAKSADTSRSNSRRDGVLLITDNADTQQVECDFLHLRSSSSDEFSVKGGSNSIKSRLKSSLKFLG